MSKSCSAVGLSDWTQASKDKFSGNPARIFPCDEGKDEEL